MNLGRSFFSLYFLIVCCFGTLSWLLDEFWSMNVEQNVESYTGYKTVLKALDEKLTEDEPVENWQNRISIANDRFGLPLIMVSSAQAHTLMPDHDFIKGDADTVFYDDDQITIFHQMSIYDKVLILGPVASPTRPRIEALIRVLILVLLGVVIFFWVWPISKDLDKLDKTAREFGQGDFKAKVTDGTSALVQPMLNTFNMMAGRINGLIEAHKELTNAVSHELRTPLARTKFALQVLRGAKDDETREKYVDKIATDVEELESLVNELLVYAAFESEQPNIRYNHSDLRKQIAYQVEGFQHQQHDVEFTCDVDEFYVDFDGHFISRAMSNLITNAMKYGNGLIRVSLLQDDKNCSLIVEDNGPGIDDDFKNIIFDAFSRYDKSRGKDTGGFGLGLAIVSKIMLWHNGEAKVEDSELGGAKFILSWPINHLI
ncbi:ATP-binding protein [Colwelliaceae bacterium BS250]